MNCKFSGLQIFHIFHVDLWKNEEKKTEAFFRAGRKPRSAITWRILLLGFVRLQG